MSKDFLNYTVELVQSDTLFPHPTKIYGSKVFLLTKINPEFSNILCNPTHFPGPLVCQIRQVPLYICLGGVMSFSKLHFTNTSSNLILINWETMTV